jgi:hypothetical protein
MAEFQSRWTIPEKSENALQSATDRTDRLGPRGVVVSPVSGIPHQNQDNSALQSCAKNYLIADEAAALGLDPTLRWIHVYRSPIVATTPPADLNGTVPVGCGVPEICGTLGPCEPFIAHGRCWAAGESAGNPRPT